MAENLPDDYEERSRPSSNRIEAEGDRRHDAMANMLARPESLQEYFATSAELGLRSATIFRKMAERIIYRPRYQRLFEDAARELLPPLSAAERRRRRLSGKAIDDRRGGAASRAAGSTRQGAARDRLKNAAAAAAARDAALRQVADSDLKPS